MPAALDALTDEQIDALEARDGRDDNIIVESIIVTAECDDCRERSAQGSFLQLRARGWYISSEIYHRCGKRTRVVLCPKCIAIPRLARNSAT